MRKKIIATGGIVTTLLIAGASTTFAHTATMSPHRFATSTSAHIKNRVVPSPKLEEIALKLGLSVDDVKEELRSGKTPKQILEEQGVSQSEIKKIFRNKYRKFHANNRNQLIQIHNEPIR